MPKVKNKSAMPPVPKHAAPGTETSDRYGNVVSTRPAPAPSKPPPAAPAPTSDRHGNIISKPDGYAEKKPLPPGAVTGTQGPNKSAPTSKIHFQVHGGMRELLEYARAQGWADRGFSHLSVPWQELVYTTDDWKTQHTLKSSDVPSPVVNGFFSLNVPKGTTVEFAVHVGVACQAPSDVSGYRERGDLWLNNGGENFRQTTQ